MPIKVKELVDKLDGITRNQVALSKILGKVIDNQKKFSEKLTGLDSKINYFLKREDEALAMRSSLPKTVVKKKRLKTKTSENTAAAMASSPGRATVVEDIDEDNLPEKESSSNKLKTKEKLEHIGFDESAIQAQINQMIANSQSL